MALFYFIHSFTNSEINAFKFKFLAYTTFLIVFTISEEGPCPRGFIRLPLRCTENKTDNCRPYRKFY